MSRSFKKSKSGGATRNGNRYFRQLGQDPDVGPGGWSCACCAPKKGVTRDRKFRAARRRDHQLVKDIIKNTNTDIS